MFVIFYDEIRSTIYKKKRMCDGYSILSMKLKLGIYDFIKGRVSLSHYILYKFDLFGY